MSELEVKEVKMQASNIDEEGNVLFLDEERLARKEVGFPPFKNKPRGLGILNFVKSHITYMNPKRWPIVLKLYKFFIRFSVWMKKGGIRAFLYKRMIMLAPDKKAHTSTVIMPLNIDLANQGEKVTVPMDIAKQAVEHATFIAGMDTCLCREANDCKDYPHDMACLFFGDVGRVIVKHGLGRQLTAEEACARIDRAAELGLPAQAVWIEVEQFLWGVRNDQMDKFLEICFCCPCCCIAMRLARNATSRERHRFHPAGWTAVPNRTKCVGCGQCVNTENGCPVEAISIGEDGKVVINQDMCAGCGICKTKCKVGAIEMKQTMPMRRDLHEYFLRDFNLDIKVFDNLEEEEAALSKKEENLND